MASLEDDEDSAQSSDNDVDEQMDELDEGDADQTLDMETEVVNDDDNEDNEDEEDQDDTQDLPDDTPTRPRAKPFANQSMSGQNSRLKVKEEGSASTGEKVDSMRNNFGSGSPHRLGAVQATAAPFRPVVRAEAITANTYDIVPTIAAPHSTSINAITATPDTRWVFSGGADGYVRKFNWIDTVNGRTLLTVAQRHPFVDSVTKCGVLMSYWENEEAPYKDDAPQNPDETIALSPVHSLAVQHQALWLLSGTEAGIINLQAVRHDEGKRITSLNKHTSAISVMKLSQDETSFLSGSWDKTIHDWDLNTGQIRRSFMGSGSQISALEMRPDSTLPVPRETQMQLTTSTTFSSNNAEKSKQGSGMNGIKQGESRRDSAIDGLGSPSDSLFGGNGDNDSLFGDNDTIGEGGLPFGETDGEDELSKALANGIQDQDKVDGDGDGDMGMRSVDELDNPLFGEGANNLTSHEDQLGATTELNGDSDMAFIHNAEMAGNEPTVSKQTEPNSSPPPATSESTFLDSAIDGTLRIWDRRQPNPITRIVPPRSVPPWCMHACWSPDGNFIYAGRRNGTVEEYSLHKGLHEPHRTLKFPAGSGSVSALCPMPNGRHLVCASFDILRLYDLQDEESARHSKVPFLIVPGHRTGVVSQLYMDPTSTFMISTGGNRGWEGSSTEVLLGYEIAIGR